MRRGHLVGQLRGFLAVHHLRRSRACFAVKAYSVGLAVSAGAFDSVLDRIFADGVYRNGLFFRSRTVDFGFGCVQLPVAGPGIGASLFFRLTESYRATQQEEQKQTLFHRASYAS